MFYLCLYVLIVQYMFQKKLYLFVQNYWMEQIWQIINLTLNIIYYIDIFLIHYKNYDNYLIVNTNFKWNNYYIILLSFKRRGAINSYVLLLLFLNLYFTINNTNLLIRFIKFSTYEYIEFIIVIFYKLPTFIYTHKINDRIF